MNKEFREFLTSNLFNIHPTKSYKMLNSDLYKTTGNTPVLSNSSADNGIGGYSNLSPTEKGGIITFSDTTTGTDTMFYQPNDFIGYPHVQGLYPYDKDNWNEKQCLYFISVMKKACGVGWSYSNKFTRKFVLNTTPVLPIKTDKDGNPLNDASHLYHNEGFIPDFDYMEQYIVEAEQKRINILEQCLIADNLNDCKLSVKDKEILNKDNLIYKDFKCGDLFTSQTGDTDLQQKDINGKGCYFINSGVENNGVKGKTDRYATIFPANTITIDFWGNAYYRDYEYKMATHNHVFSLSGDVIKNEAVGLYLVSKMKYMKKIFSYGDMGTWNKIKQLNISLPIQVLPDGTPVIDTTCKYHPDGYIPDFDYMEKYIKAIEKVVMSDVVKFKDQMIEQCEKIVGE